MNLRSTLLGGATALAVGSLAGAAMSQTVAANSTSATPSNTTLGEVVVVARKRSEDLQKVPVAVTAQSGQQLQQQSIRQPTDLARIVPSLVTASGASSPSGVLFTIRGQSASDVLLTLSQPVGLYEDGVNIPHPIGADIGFFDLSQVEVLNGPQGTLYGRNTTGGAINILTRGADYDGVHGYVIGEGGNFADWKAGGAVNIPLISDVLSVRLAYQHWNRDGFGKSAITGERLGDPHDDDVARLSVRFDPNPAFSASLKVEYDHANRTDDLYQTNAFTPPGMFTAGACAGGIPLASSGGLPSAGMYCPALNGTTHGGAGTAFFEWLTEGSKGGVDPITLVARQNGDIFTNYSGVNTFEHLSAWHGALDMAWKVTDDITLRSITGLHEVTDFRTFDLSALPMQAFLVGFGQGGLTPALGTDSRKLQPDEKSTQWTEEVNLSGNAIDQRLHWLLGGFYSHDSGSEDEVASLLQGLTGFDLNFNSPQITNRSWALFTQEDFKLSNVFSITGGIRYTDEQVSQNAQDYIFFLPGSGSPIAGLVDCLAGGAGGSPIQPNGAGCAVSQALHSTGWSYLISLNAQLTPDILAYAKTARGFRGGALQQRAPQAPAAGPETNTDYEIGIKSDWFDHRLRANLDAYLTQYHNKQETQIVDIGGAQATVILNSAQARIYGVEGQFLAIPFPGLTLNATFDYLHGSYQSFPNALTPDNTSVNASGVLFPLPQWAFDIGGRYVHDLGPGQIALQADYAWHAAIPQTVLNVDPTFKALNPTLVDSLYASVGLVNARVEFNLPHDGLSIAVFATNLLDKHYRNFALGFVGASSDYGWTTQTQEPRMWGITIRKSFGPGE